MISKWFIILRPRANAKLWLFCFPYAGGNAATYIPWVKYLPKLVELVIIQPPGRANRISEPPFMVMRLSQPVVEYMEEETTGEQLWQVRRVYLVESTSVINGEITGATS